MLSRAIKTFHESTMHEASDEKLPLNDFYLLENFHTFFENNNIFIDNKNNDIQ